MAALKNQGAYDICFETTVSVVPHKNVTKVVGYYFRAVGHLKHSVYGFRCQVSGRYGGQHIEDR
jgi:hypothetical protein